MLANEITRRESAGGGEVVPARLLDDVRAQLAEAETPAEVNSVRLRAAALKALLASAVQDGASHLAELYREAQVLALEAQIALGERAPTGGRAGRKSASEAVASLANFAREAGVPRSVAKDARTLALARRAAREAFDALVAEALDAGRPIPLGKLRALCPRVPRRPSGKPTVGDTQVAARIDAELLALVDDMAKRTKTDRAEVARRALEVYLRPEASDAHEVLQRALLPLTFERRLLAKVALAADEATYCAGKFGERPWKAIARALEGARAEALKLAGVEQDDDGMELEP